MDEQYDEDFKLNQIMFLADIYYDYRRALKVIECLLRKEPKDIYFNRVLCNILISKHDFVRAEKRIAMYSRLLPKDDPDKWKMRTFLEIERKNYAKARRFISLAKKISFKKGDKKEYKDCLWWEISVELYDSKNNKAIQLIESACKLFPGKKSKQEFLVLMPRQQKCHKKSTGIADHDKLRQDYRKYKKYLFWDWVNEIYRIAPGAVLLDITGTQWVRMDGKELHNRFCKKLKVSKTIQPDKLEDKIGEACLRIIKKKKWIVPNSVSGAQSP